jgi:hypothetical protein
VVPAKVEMLPRDLDLDADDRLFVVADAGNHHFGIPVINRSLLDGVWA